MDDFSQYFDILNATKWEKELKKMEDSELKNLAGHQIKGIPAY